MDELDKKIAELLPKPNPVKEEKIKGIFAGRDIIVNYKSTPAVFYILVLFLLFILLFFS